MTILSGYYTFVKNSTFQKINFMLEKNQLIHMDGFLH